MARCGSPAAIACKAAASRSARAWAGAHTECKKSSAACGVFAIVSARRECAKLSQPRSRARSVRNRTINGAIVGQPAGFAALRPGAKRLFPQVAARRELQERRDARTRQGDAMLAGKAAGRCRPRRGGDERRGKAGEIVLRRENQHIGLLVGENVLTESGGERGEVLGDCGEPRLGFLRKAAAVAQKGGVIALQNPRLFGIKPEFAASRIKRIDALE